VLVVDQARGIWGAQRYLLGLAPLLREHSIELVLGAPRRLELYDAWIAAGFTAIELELPVARSIRSPAGRPSGYAVLRQVVTGLRSALLIARSIRGGSYDAVWANAHWIHLEAALAGRLCATPVVVHLHEEALPGLGRWLRAVAVCLATRTVAVSQMVQRNLPRWIAPRAEVIPNGVDTATMSPPSQSDAHLLESLRAGFGVGPQEVMALAATRIDPTKHIEDLIATIDPDDDPVVHLVVAGSTSGFPEYEEGMRVHAEKSAGQRITFCGRRDDMVALFQASDLLLHAGTVEGMPLGVIEAQSCGRPVVAYDVAGVAEAVIHGETGLLCAASDVAGLRSNLNALARDHVRRHSMGLAARLHVLAHHQLADQATRNAELLHQMCCPYVVEAS
jgi:glycosyltransferase involved in cell wall biosynthesis